MRGAGAARVGNLRSVAFLGLGRGKKVYLMDQVSVLDSLDRPVSVRACSCVCLAGGVEEGWFGGPVFCRFGELVWLFRESSETCVLDSKGRKGRDVGD